MMAPRSGDRLLVDCGEIGPDYLPGHAHCDTLSFELSLSGQRVVVDSGCGIYVDGLNQPEIWGHIAVPDGPCRFPPS